MVERPTTKPLSRKRTFRPLVMRLLMEPQLTSDQLYLPSGYETVPSRQEIVAMNFQTNNFKISNGRTSIEWRGPMDLATAIPTTLAELLEFGDDFVEVYRDCSLTPPIGMGFNRQCVATFSNGRQYVSKVASYPQLLKALTRLCRRNDTELLAFDIDTCKWKVRINHFTKLIFDAGLMNEGEEDGDEDEIAEASISHRMPPAMPAQVDRTISPTKHTHYRDTMETEDEGA